jgi:hypothetical protein
LGVADIKAVGLVKGLSDMFSQDAVAHFEAAIKMGDAPDKDFLSWLKEEPRTWQQVLDQYCTTAMKE